MYELRRLSRQRQVHVRYRAHLTTPTTTTTIRVVVLKKELLDIMPIKYPIREVVLCRHPCTPGWYAMKRISSPVEIQLSPLRLMLLTLIVFTMHLMLVMLITPLGPKKLGPATLW